MSEDWWWNSEASRQSREWHPGRVGGRQPCCGATNAPCDTAMRDVFTILWTCERCGHDKGCHN